MPPKWYLTKSVGSLIAAYKGCTLYQLGTDPHQDFFYPTNGSDQYKLTEQAWQCIASILRDSVAYLDQYPEADFKTFLLNNVADVRKTHSEPNGALQRELSNRLEVFFAKFGNQKEWDVLSAVSGIARDQAAFTVGSVHFRILDEHTYNDWRTPFHSPAARLNDNLVEEWIALIRLPAINQGHAIAKSLARLEEVLNVLRYGNFRHGNPWMCVRLGAGGTSYWGSQALARPVACPQAVGQSMKDGSAGLRLQFCQWTRGYGDIVKVIEKPPASRTPLERKVLSAITWIGQAVAAALEPVRLALLVTALEVLLIDDSEIRGKGTKIAKRLAALVTKVIPSETRVMAVADHLYDLRSKCLHAGSTRVTKDEVETAFSYASAVITAFLTLEPYNRCDALGDVLAIIDPKGTAPDDYSI